MLNSLKVFLVVIIGVTGQGYGPSGGGPPGGWAQGESWKPPSGWGPPPGTYDDTWVITPPQSPGPVIIPGLQDLGQCKDSINWCLTDIKAQGLIHYYYAIVDNAGNDMCYLVQSLFNGCIADLNCRTCTIFTLENGGALCNVYNSTSPDITQTIINIHYGNNNTDIIMPFIVPSTVRDLVIATNLWCT